MLVNLTPHTVNIIQGEKTITVPASGTVARCSTTKLYAGHYDGIELSTVEYGNIVGLPDEIIVPPNNEPSILYIVSTLVRAAVPHRLDVASPGELVRDANGNPVGCQGLIVNSPPLT